MVYKVMKRTAFSCAEYEWITGVLSIFLRVRRTDQGLPGSIAADRKPLCRFLFFPDKKVQTCEIQYYGGARLLAI